jgi:hypothetical protein
MDLLPYVECMPLAPQPRLLLGPLEEWRLALGLAPEFSGFVELGHGMPEPPPHLWEECLESAGAGGVAMLLTTASAYAHDVPCPFMASLSRRFPTAACLPAMEMALYEAVANAIIHGNLGVDSSLRSSAAGLREYRDTLARALADPVLAGRRLAVCCYPAGKALRLSVHDEGAGWDMETQLATVASNADKSGRGVDLIRQISTAMRTIDNGRQLVMDFNA